VIRVGFIPSKTRESILVSMKQGIGFIRTKAGLDSLIVLAFCMTIFGFQLLTFLPVFARQVFHGDAKTYTQLLVCSGAGSVCGALIVAALGRTKRQGRTALMGLIVLGGLIAAFSLSKTLLLSSVLIFLGGAALITVFAMIQSVVQAITADEMMGRVMSVYNVAFRGGMPVGSLIMGKLIPLFTVSLTMAASGSLLVVLGLYFLLVHRRIATL
jgi:predicted MFS family arabinose efflux permease